MKPDNDNSPIFEHARATTNIFAVPATPVSNPYRTNAKWLRDQSGKLIRDEDGLPVREPRKVTRRAAVVDPRKEALIAGTDNKYKIAKTLLEGKLMPEHTPAERALMQAKVEHARALRDGQIIAAVERSTSGMHISRNLLRMIIFKVGNSCASFAERSAMTMWKQ